MPTPTMSVSKGPVQVPEVAREVVVVVVDVCVAVVRCNLQCTNHQYNTNLDIRCSVYPERTHDLCSRSLDHLRPVANESRSATGKGNLDSCKPAS